MLSWYRKDLKVAYYTVVAGNCFYCTVMDVTTVYDYLDIHLFRH